MAAATVEGVVAVRRLEAHDEAALDELLEQDRLVNLFLRGFLASQAMDRGWWYGVQIGERLQGVVLLLPSRLCVPWAPGPDVAAELGVWLARRHRPTMMVGPRDAVDVIWSEWGEGPTPRRFYDQRLYVHRNPQSGPSTKGFRPARPSEWPLLASRSARMEWEDLGRDPSKDDPELHRRTVRERIQSGKTWVMERNEEVVFQINLGTRTPDGCQVGGTYVPPHHRRQGYSTLGMQALLRTLSKTCPVVTLHVNEANEAAVRCYERVGFEPSAAYRLLTV